MAISQENAAESKNSKCNTGCKSRLWLWGEPRRRKKVKWKEGKFFHWDKDVHFSSSE
jgi:hypothetical protein